MSGEDPTGGLTLEPPGADDDEAAAGIGFAPDLASDGALPPVFVDDGARVARASERARYPRARAALAALLGRALDDDDVHTRDASRAATARRGEAHHVGPAITRAPAAFVKPRDRYAEPERTTPVPGSEALTDLMLLGTNTDGTREAHVQFQEDVLGGMYVHVERRDDGLFLRFTVGDDSARRTMSAYVDDLVRRFEKKGTRVVGFEIVVDESE